MPKLVFQWASVVAREEDLDELKRLVDIEVAAEERGDRREFLERGYYFHQQCWRFWTGSWLLFSRL